MQPRASKTGTRKHAQAVPLRAAQSAEKVLPGSDLDATVSSVGSAASKNSTSSHRCDRSLTH